jgi:hypothetical protein
VLSPHPTAGDGECLRSYAEQMLSPPTSGPSKNGKKVALSGNRTKAVPSGVSTLESEQLALYYRGLRCYHVSNPGDQEAAELHDAVRGLIHARSESDTVLAAVDTDPPTAEGGDESCDTLAYNIVGLSAASFRDPETVLPELETSKPFPLQTTEEPPNHFSVGAGILGDRNWGGMAAKARPDVRDWGAYFSMGFGAAQWLPLALNEDLTAPKLLETMRTVDKLSFRSKRDLLAMAFGIPFNLELESALTPAFGKFMREHWYEAIPPAAMMTAGAGLYSLAKKREPDKLETHPGMAAFHPGLALANAALGKNVKPDNNNPLNFGVGNIVPHGIPGSGNLLPFGPPPALKLDLTTNDNLRKIYGGEAQALLNIGNILTSKKIVDPDLRLNAAVWGGGKYVSEPGKPNTVTASTGFHAGASGLSFAGNYGYSSTEGGTQIQNFRAAAGWRGEANDPLQDLNFGISYSDIKIESGATDATSVQLGDLNGLLQFDLMGALRFPIKKRSALVIKGNIRLTAQRTNEEGMHAPTITGAGGSLHFTHDSAEEGEFQVIAGAERGAFQPGVAGTPHFTRGTIRLMVMPDEWANSVARGYGIGVALQQIDNVAMSKYFSDQIYGKSAYGDTTSVTFTFEIYFAMPTNQQRECHMDRLLNRRFPRPGEIQKPESCRKP